MWKRTMATTLWSAFGIAVLTVNSGCLNATAGPPPASNRLESAGPGELRRLDLNRDGRIDASDLAYYASATKADVNGDERVDQDDVSRMGSFFGQTYPQELSGLTASELAWVARISAADLNGDHAVSASDLSLFGMLQPMAERADVNDDGRVNADDLAEIEKNLGNQITPSIGA